MFSPMDRRSSFPPARLRTSYSRFDASSVNRLTPFLFSSPPRGFFPLLSVHPEGWQWCLRELRRNGRLGSSGLDCCKSVPVLQLFGHRDFECLWQCPVKPVSLSLRSFLSFAGFRKDWSAFGNDFSTEGGGEKTQFLRCS